ncbi:MAG TPA: valine--tRNA ligase [Candidatus Pacearchaeota archaeon]|nr:valine--tRNA ligase [Candidatus Pacearchaeota archaeon]HRU20748.1 valine--tRNA ligase [Candidatus Paceibacterota bacterium]HPC30562.1 valine--tRNA ligase [Candidatus Pacearchaeota archaeon]HQG09440.1 valine--tRNA ligase [Candidatus Pacearchaeota archaeon]HQH20355.1 valine--tRNA ligase [Candidatus Pacearchaeota archaeon]
MDKISLKTDAELPKNYDFKTAEARWIKNWAENKYFEFNRQNSGELFVVDTPPPYVSADHLHAGHIMSYAQAEFIVRYKRMRGFNVFYPMGFDDNGLPTERFVEKKYKIDKSKTTRSEFIKLCLSETEKGIQTYKELWNALGISVDWTKTYSTIAPLATKVSQKSILDLYKKGLLYKKELPILWCPFCQTAISQSDLEDKTRESKMNYINFRSMDNKDLLIATTRPELIPACVALYANPTDTRFKHLIGQKARVPIFEYEVPILSSEKVALETGTGLMMVCTWGDQEDLEKWRADNLDTRHIITEDGHLNNLAGPYEGLTILEAREKILADLKNKNLLVKQETIEQVLNVHERCETPVELIQSQQWFIKITELKEKWIELGRQIHWYPDYMINNYELWVNSLKWDWCVSRQRFFGVPFPFWNCADCGEIILPNENDLPINPFEQKPPLSQCPHCGSQKIEPEADVMDTWATSSCTPFLLRELGGSEDLFPVDLRPNAHEIIRTWDFYSIVKGYYNFNTIPFKNIMVSGHGLDEQGRKISKRLGNYTPADKLVEQYGADAIRYWATGAGLGQNLRFSEIEIKKGKQIATKLWNAGKFILTNCKDYDPNEPAIFEPADNWIIQELNQTIAEATNNFEEYQYAKAKTATEEFFMSKFADYYVEFVKYRLYGENTMSKRAAQNTLINIFINILKLYAPLIPFVTEELFQYFSNEPTIHLSKWPETLKMPAEIDLSDFDKAIKAIDEIRKYKSENKISLGAELEEYKLTTKVNLEKYGEFIRKAIRVKNLI